MLLGSIFISLRILKSFYIGIFLCKQWNQFNDIWGKNLMKCNDINVRIWNIYNGKTVELHKNTRY